MLLEAGAGAGVGVVDGIGEGEDVGMSVAVWVGDRLGVAVGMGGRVGVAVDVSINRRKVGLGVSVGWFDSGSQAIPRLSLCCQIRVAAATQKRGMIARSQSERRWRMGGGGTGGMAGICWPQLPQKTAAA
ncbi:MAG: hypothetical protein Fur0021_20750 [Candidatus Promineifilaceae bacterium]